MFQDFDILQIFDSDASPSARRAIRFAAGIGCALGASSFVSGVENIPDLAGLADLSDCEVDVAPTEWAKDTSAKRHRVVLRAVQPGSQKLMSSEISSVTVELEQWQSEETLFAASGLARLLGDPDRAPLVPAANYGAHSVGYAVFAALTAVAAVRVRYGRAEQAWLHGEAALAWINWKAVVAGTLGEDLKREGKQAEWPVLPCKDGHVAFVFTERDWDRVAEMIGDPVLKNIRFKTFEGRAKCRAEYMVPIENWCAGLTKAELAKAFVEWEIPAAPISTISDLLSDPLLAHRGTFSKITAGYISPALPHRIEQESTGAKPKIDSAGALPLSGLTVLDLGIITAGAGVSALLADMGATVIKVESNDYPDPFRSWAGATKGDSPLFKSNNRNKQGVALDLKTEEGLKAFLKLAETADIVIENFRRGVLDRLGLTFERLAQANPTVLIASISGQGLSGPGAQHTTFGSTLEASSGFASMTCYDDGVPVISGRNLNYPDQIVCMYGAAIIASQAIECRRGGISRHLDISQRDCAIYQIGDLIGRLADDTASDATTTCNTADRSKNSDMLRCADGEYVAINSGTTVGLNSLIGDLNLIDLAAKMAAADCAQALLKSGVGAVLVRSGADLLNSLAIQKAETFATSPNSDLVKGFPFQLIQSPMSIHCDAPTVGQHTLIILSSHGEATHVD